MSPPVDITPVVTEVILLLPMGLTWFDSLQFMVSGVTLSVLDVACGMIIIANALSVVQELMG